MQIQVQLMFMSKMEGGGGAGGLGCPISITLLVPDGLVQIFQKLLIWSFHLQQTLQFLPNGVEKQKSSWLVDERVLLVTKVTITQITTRYNHGEQKSVSGHVNPGGGWALQYNSRRPLRVPLVSAENRNVRCQSRMRHASSGQREVQGPMRRIEDAFRSDRSSHISEAIWDAYFCSVNTNASQCVLDSNKGPTNRLRHRSSWKICNRSSCWKVELSVARLTDKRRYASSWFSVASFIVSSPIHF